MTWIDLPLYAKIIAIVTIASCAFILFDMWRMDRNLARKNAIREGKHG